MKILILSVTAGNGHNAAANAAAESLKSRGAEVLVVDMFKYAGRTYYDTVDKGYLLSTKYIPKPYGRLYSALERNPALRRRIIGMITTELITTSFPNSLRTSIPTPSSAHTSFAQWYWNELKAKTSFTHRLSASSQDYTFHPFWDTLPLIEYIVTRQPSARPHGVKEGHPCREAAPFWDTGAFEIHNTIRPGGSAYEAGP